MAEPTRRKSYHRLAARVIPWPFVLVGSGAVLAAALLAAPRAEAALIAYEGFNYAANSTVIGQGTNAGWSTAGQKWTGATTATLEVPGSDYNYYNLVHSGNVVDVKGNGEGVFRSLGSTYSTIGADHWISMVIDVDSNVAGSYAGLSLFLSTDPIKKEKFFIGQDMGHSTWSMELSANSTQAASGTPITPQKAVFLAVELNGITGQANLYVEPSGIGATAPGTPSSSLSFSGNQFSFDEIRIQSGGTQVMDVDEFRFGTSYADVAPTTSAPEPSSWLLLVTGMVASIVLRGVGGSIAARRPAG